MDSRRGTWYLVGIGCLVLLWEVVTWALLVPCVVGRAKEWVWAVFQGVVLVLLFAGFWHWGNGKGQDVRHAQEDLR